MSSISFKMLLRIVPSYLEGGCMETKPLQMDFQSKHQLHCLNKQLEGQKSAWDQLRLWPELCPIFTKNTYNLLHIDDNELWVIGTQEMFLDSQGMGSPHDVANWRPCASNSGNDSFPPTMSSFSLALTPLRSFKSYSFAKLLWNKKDSKNLC